MYCFCTPVSSAITFLSVQTEYTEQTVICQARLKGAYPKNGFPKPQPARRAVLSFRPEPERTRRRSGGTCFPRRLLRPSAVTEITSCSLCPCLQYGTHVFSLQPPALAPGSNCSRRVFRLFPPAINNRLLCRASRHSSQRGQL